MAAITWTVSVSTKACNMEFSTIPLPLFPHTIFRLPNPTIELVGTITYSFPSYLGPYVLN